MLAIFLALCLSLAHAARVKDIADVYGVRDNVVSGVGLVTGLNRSGDSARNAATIQTVAKRLQGHGITLPVELFQPRNVAIVMVNARLPASYRPGQRLDVEVSSMGDATSLEGGVLQLTPLFAADRQAYALAQGPLVVGGFSVEQEGTGARKNHPTVGRVPMGATVERENANRLAMGEMQEITWLLKQPDFTTAQRLAAQVNASLGQPLAQAQDDSVVSVKVPADFAGRTVDFIAQIEVLDVSVDTAARIVVNERTGTVVMGSDVKISPVAVAFGGLSIEVKRSLQASQPEGILSGGQTVVVPNNDVQVTEADGRLTLVGGVTIGELVAALNKMGVKPRDLIQILIAIEAAGALHAQLEVQ